MFGARVLRDVRDQVESFLPSPRLFGEVGSFLPSPRLFGEVESFFPNPCLLGARALRDGRGMPPLFRVHGVRVHSVTGCPLCLGGGMPHECLVRVYI